MAVMTRKERLMAIFTGKTPDRSAVKIWGAEPGQGCIHKAFEPVRDRAAQKTDLVLGRGAPFHMYCGRYSQALVEVRTEPTDSPLWLDRVTLYHTPAGELRGISYQSTINKPGYEKEYPLKEPQDIDKLLSMPYEPFEFTDAAYRQAEASLGDAGIVQFHIGHPMYALQAMIGSENFALWSVEAPQLLLKAVEVFAQRLRDHVKQALSAGIRGVFGWVGPELCIPPLMPPAAFERYVFAIDKPLVDLIRNAGARVWLHCHGKMSPVLRRFADMGVDVLNPIEPPPMGDVTLEQAFAMAGERMGLEGNIETHDFMTGTREQLRQKIHNALEAGIGRRHILCPSSGYMENVEPTAREIEKWLFYIDEGVRYAEELSRR